MRKNGFVATSVLYSVFITFISIFLLYIAYQVSGQIMIKTNNDKIRERLLRLDMPVSDLKTGDIVASLSSTGYERTLIVISNDEDKITLVEIRSDRMIGMFTATPGASVDGVTLRIFDDATIENVLTLNDGLKNAILNYIGNQTSYDSIRYHSDNSTYTYHTGTTDDEVFYKNPNGNYYITKVNRKESSAHIRVIVEIAKTSTIIDYIMDGQGTYASPYILPFNYNY